MHIDKKTFRSPLLHSEQFDPQDHGFEARDGDFENFSQSESEVRHWDTLHETEATSLHTYMNTSESTKNC